jgi:hypothetical protein
LLMRAALKEFCGFEKGARARAHPVMLNLIQPQRMMAESPPRFPIPRPGSTMRFVVHDVALLANGDDVQGTAALAISEETIADTGS